MHWRYIKVAIVGGLLGFAGQCFGDFFCWKLSGSTPYQYSMSTREKRVMEHFFRAQYVQQANQLIWQAVFLMWLRDRGELAGRTAAIAAFLGVSTMLGADQIRARRKAQKEVTVS